MFRLLCFAIIRLLHYLLDAYVCKTFTKTCCVRRPFHTCTHYWKQRGWRIANKGGLLSTSHINLSISSTTDSRMTQDTRLVQHLTQLAGNCSVASARGQTETCASYPYQQLFCCLENGSCRIRRQLVSCQCVRPSIKQWSPSGQQKRCSTKVASARLA
jgi:hypothetical protein